MKIKQIVRENVGWIITGLLILLFLLLFFWERIFISIYPGQAGVLYRRLFQDGTDIHKAYPEGLSIILPWNKMFIYNVRVQEKKQTVNVLSQNGLTIQVNVSVRYYLEREKTPILHQKVGPDFERKIIIPSTISSVREVVGEYLPEELYTTARHVIQDKLLIEVVEETGRIPIVYDALIVENIKLPELINTAIEAKLRQQQRYLEYQYKIKQAEAEIIRKKNEAIGIRQYQNIVKESLSPDLLKWKGIMATLDLAKSPNSKVVVVGGGEGGLPIIFNAEGALNSPANAHPAGFTTDMHKPGYQETDSHQTSGPDQNYGQDDEQKEPHGQEQSPPATPPYGSGDGQGGQNHMNQDRMPEDHQGQIRQGQLHGAATHDTRMHNDVSTSDVNTSDVSTSGPSGSERSGTSHSGFAQRAKDRLFKDFKGLMGGARPDADQTNTEKGGVHVQ